MAKFDSMYFENNRCHVLAGVRNAEEHFESCDAEGVKIALDCAFGHLGNMRNEIERHSETVEARKALAQYDEMKARYFAIKAKYDSKYGKLEELDPEEVEIEDEEDKEEKNEDASIVKLNVAVRNAINILSAIKESSGGLTSIELIDSTLLLLDELEEVVENDVDDIRERLEDMKKDAKIVEMVENVKDAFDARLRDKLVEDSIERLKALKNRESDETVELTNEAIFAAIHQDVDDRETVFEEVNHLDDKVWTANRFGVAHQIDNIEDLELVYEVTKNNECWSRDLDLFIKQGKTRHPLATIRFKGYDNEAFRKISAIGCEYSIAFDHFNEIL